MLARHASRLVLTCLVGALILIFSSEASAYIDPGTGSFLLQMLIAGIVGAGFAIGIFWRSVKGFFARLFRRRPSELDNDGEG
jgi:hypothetical protein